MMQSTQLFRHVWAAGVFGLRGWRRRNVDDARGRDAHCHRRAGAGVREIIHSRVSHRRRQEDSARLRRVRRSTHSSGRSERRLMWKARVRRWRRHTAKRASRPSPSRCHAQTGRGGIIVLKVVENAVGQAARKRLALFRPGAHQTVRPFACARERCRISMRSRARSSRSTSGPIAG